VVGADRYLSAEQAATMYDRVGRWQDTQSFYEHRAVDALVRAGGFGSVASVVEIGCGTGALAARLLRNHLPAHAHYLGLDVSAHMVALAGSRIHAWADRAHVQRITGHQPWPVPDTSTDRVVCAYVLDLLAPAAIREFFTEAARVLRPDGLVATAGLAPAPTGLPHLVSTGWLRLWRLNPHLTGGCRPVDEPSPGTRRPGRRGDQTRSARRPGPRVCAGRVAVAGFRTPTRVGWTGVSAGAPSANALAAPSWDVRAGKDSRRATKQC
jgi:ubiquinone/menaquinone biosynthesis C-methylase UbiE